MNEVERLSTGIEKLDEILCGGIPRGFFVAVTGEPGTGKTICCISFIHQGILSGDRCIYVSTEESIGSITRQASQFSIDFRKAVDERTLLMIDALLGKDEPWSIKSLEIDSLIEKVLEAKKHLGYGRARLVIDSLSAFWLDRPAMARKYSYYLKKVLSKWDFTILATSQYAISTSEAFGWGVEHVADGILRFRRSIRDGMLRRYLIVEKMRQTPHSLEMFEVSIVDGEGLKIIGPSGRRREDVALPSNVVKKIKRAKEKTEAELQT